MKEDKPDKQEWQAALQSDLRKLWRAVEQSPSTVLITDSDGNIEYVNPKFVDLTGYTHSEVIGENPRVLNSGKQPPEFYKKMWDTITSGREWRGEFCNKKKNGELYWEFASISAVRDADGRITNYVAVKEDVTARKKVEAQLADAIEELRSKNVELEQAIKELKEIQIELVETERIAALVKLTAGITHEINTPLGVLLSSISINDRCLQMIHNSISSADTLQDVLEDEQYVKGMEVLQSGGKQSELAATRIKEVVRCLKGFIHLDEAGRQLVDIHTGLEDTLVLLQHRIVDNIKIEKELGSIPKTYCNPSEINQAFLIILSNALDAIEGDGTVRLRTFESDSDIHVEIEDDGKGISADRLDRIFDFHFTRKGQRIGFGFKLPSAMMIMRRHGGNITVNSEPGKGSTFTVILPIKGL